MPFSIEVEKIVTNGKIKKTVVYYGTANKIKLANELEFIQGMIYNCNDEKMSNRMNEFLQKICN